MAKPEEYKTTISLKDAPFVKGLMEDFNEILNKIVDDKLCIYDVREAAYNMIEKYTKEGEE